jgi:hypothetical protein
MERDLSLAFEMTKRLALAITGFDGDTIYEKMKNRSLSNKA